MTYEEALVEYDARLSRGEICLGVMGPKDPVTGFRAVVYPKGGCTAGMLLDGLKPLSKSKKLSFEDAWVLM
jgi:hypothetical protein